MNTAKDTGILEYWNTGVLPEKGGHGGTIMGINLGTGVYRNRSAIMTRLSVS